MKKVLPLVGVGALALLAGGQFYSSKMTSEYLQKGSQEMARNGVKVQHKDVETGFFKSKANDVIVFQVEQDEFVVTLDYDITHLPWGGSFDGTAEVQMTTPEKGTQKIFSELLKTDALLDGGFNVFSGGHAQLAVQPFDTKKDDTTLKMEKPFLINIASNTAGTSLETTAELDKLEVFEDIENEVIRFEGLEIDARQNGNWPKTDEVDAEGQVKFAKVTMHSEKRNEHFGLDGLLVDIETAIDDGLLSYDLKANLKGFESKTREGDYKGKAKGDVRLEGIYIAPFKSFAQKVMAKIEELSAEGATPQEDLMFKAVSVVAKENQAELETSIEESFKKSAFKYQISDVAIDSNLPDFENISGDAELTLNTQAIDFAQFKDAVSTGSPFAMMAFLEYVGVKVKAKGLPADVMTKIGAAGEELDVLFKEGTLSVNGEERPLF